MLLRHRILLAVLRPSSNVCLFHQCRCDYRVCVRCLICRVCSLLWSTLPFGCTIMYRLSVYPLFDNPVVPFYKILLLLFPDPHVFVWEQSWSKFILLFAQLITCRCRSQQYRTNDLLFDIALALMGCSINRHVLVYPAKTPGKANNECG